MKVGVMGASGYVGGELLRILLLHPKVELSLATSRQYNGEYLHRVHPNLRGATDLKFTNPNPTDIPKDCDLVFTAVPHGSSVKNTPKILESGVKVIDLSADFRLKNPEEYPKWYGWQHPHPQLLVKAVYGLPELHRNEIRNASFVSCPGCMAISAILALAPLAKAGVIDKEHVIVDAKIGSSGAGIKPTLASHHAERFGVVRPYKPVGHRHTAEIEQELSLLANSAIKVSMSVHAVNMVRGILTTSHVFTEKTLAIVDVWRIYRSLYEKEPFIRFVRDRKGVYRFPDPKILIGSNNCDVGFELDEHVNRLVVMSAIDNLVKGAAGTAVQAMNIMLNFDEKLGLESLGLHPV